MSAQPLLKAESMTVEEYIEMEIASDEKHEYFGSLYAQLRGTPCAPFGSDQRVKIEETGLLTYPDISLAFLRLVFRNRSTLVEALLAQAI